MAFFINKYNRVLYVASDAGANAPFIAFIVPPAGSAPVQDPELADALTNPAYQGIFIFSAAAPALDTATQAKAFYDCIISNTPRDYRSIGWATNTNDLSALSVSVMGINNDGSQVITGLNADLTGGNMLNLIIPNGTAIRLSGTVLQFSSNTAIAFSGPSAPVGKPVYEATVDCSGSLRGCICFTGYLRRDTIMADPQKSFTTGLIMGFEYLFPTPDNSSSLNEAIAGFYPLAYPLNPSSDFPGFNICIDPTDVFNTVYASQIVSLNMMDAYNSRRTFFNFTGDSFGSSDAIFLNSYFSTAYGSPVNLIPSVTGNTTLNARLVLCQAESFSGNIANFYLAPEGDFAIQITTSDTTLDNFLMCGFQGTEFFQVTPQTKDTTGDALRFISGCPAYAPGYPFATASPVGPPINYDQLPMNNAYTSSWATVIPATNNPVLYIAQPKGAALFGHDALIADSYPTLFGHAIPGFIFTPNNTTLFPLVPYTGTFTGDGHTSFTKQQLEDYEKTLISPVRRKQIGLLTSANKIHYPAPNPVQTITTPSGLLVTIDTSNNQAKWKNVLLGRNGNDTLQFVNPDPKLVEALQSGDLFLVAANATHISSGDASFDNIIDIGGWTMQINVGANPAYDDYKNIIIIKGKKGKLFEADNPGSSLVANPNIWTLPNDFATPTIPGAKDPDTGQLTNVSQWLQNYFQQAATKDDPGGYFKTFNTIAADENWTGILFLRVDINSLPANIAGIAAGVQDQSAFNVHHLAIAISPVKKSGDNAVLEHASSMFGLIYYVDPSFIDAPPYATLPASGTGSYDFRLLTLKVLFENTAVQRFESYSQLTLTQLFGSAVSHTGDAANLYNNVLLKGNFQFNGSTPVYNLSSCGDNVFYLTSNIIQKIEITKAVLTALDSKDATTAASRFNLSGFINYVALSFTREDETVPFDLFSFGSENAGKGLFFEQLAVEMSYPIATPADKTFTFNSTAITFDSSHSTARKLSLFTNFALDEITLLSGIQKEGPDKKGFLNVITDMRLSGVTGGEEWYGLKLRLNLGTPGELASKVNIQTSLLLAWSPASVDTSYQCGVYISIPGTSGGASLISLQNVLKLSIGQIRLTYDTTQNSFLLMFTEIALKFLGLLKIPPNGSTLFYLFGNPNANGKTSGLGWYAMYRKDTKALLHQ